MKLGNLLGVEFLWVVVFGVKKKICRVEVWGKKRWGGGASLHSAIMSCNKVFFLVKVCCKKLICYNNYDKKVDYNTLSFVSST